VINPEQDQGRDAIHHRARFDFVRYANCWEDADILVEALQPKTGNRILSIASAGDNVLALLASGAEVIAADVNPTQIACLELRCEGFRQLDREHLLAFLGVVRCDGRLNTYEQLRRGLTERSRVFWDEHRDQIADGIIHMGKFEAYFRAFRTRVLPWIHSPATIRQLLEPKTAAQREWFWNHLWNRWRWRLLLKVFFSRFLMERMGRDREFFRFVEGSIGEHIQRRTQYAMTVLAPDENPYLQYIATGNFTSALPRYLRPEYFDAIRGGLDRLTIVTGPIEQAASLSRAGGFDGMNLSDIFEYLSESASRSLYGKLLRTANPGARLAYWNTFVPRSCPNEFCDVVRPQSALAAELFQRDKAFFYSRFCVDELHETLGCEA
jgi:S-adenosylmethionine-diacylglycerol 3-amino-3-carboxypropyl transferase